MPPMNVESLKTELQQVLDNDVVLRKEFNELKRSLSDYRNQLIMRDEDCKRLQVTIDVLNTKLVVMERDNTTYKAELTSFKELRGTIKEQLQAKQEEIDARLNEIQSLKDDLNSMAAGYEQKIEELKSESDLELNRVREEYTNQINELKIISSYKESGLKAEYENRVSEITMGWADREQSLIQEKDSVLSEIKSQYEEEIESLKSTYETKIFGLSSGSREEIDALVEAHKNTLSSKESEYNQAIETFETTYIAEITNLRAALEEQRSTLTTNFNTQIETLTREQGIKEQQLISGYESQIGELKQTLSSSTGELHNSFQSQIEELKLAHTTLLNETLLNHETRVNSLVGEYEEKLSFTLIHSNAQNSKLNDELSRAQLDNDASMERIRELSQNIETKSNEISDLGLRISALENELKLEVEKNTVLVSDFENFKQNASLSSSEQVNELNAQIALLNTTHSDYVNELNLQIEGLHAELSNLGVLFENTTNTLSETEQNFDLVTKELDETRNQLEALRGSMGESVLEFEQVKAEWQQNTIKSLSEKEIEFNKLLAENTQLISEIDGAQDKIEAQEAEISILKTELEEVKTISAGKTADFKEMLANRSFEITNLEANNAALSQEIHQLKEELTKLEVQLQTTSQSEELFLDLQSSLDEVRNERNELRAELHAMQAMAKGLNETIQALNLQIESSQTELTELRNSTKTEEQDAFIDRLFKQIDLLNDERLALLNDKEQMANQLLKMNDVVGSISQQVDSEKIDVTSLNNHRKNVILATNSGEAGDKTQMKEQINDLVREIDKCIALLSA